MKNYLNIKICKECGGTCCKEMPGGAVPEDFGNPLFSSLEKAFASGNWAIDWWEGDPTGKHKVARGYFVRPKVKEVDQLYDPSWGGECVFLILGKGCKLSKDKRPINCRLLEPKKDKPCKLHGINKREIAIAWMPYHEMIHKIGDLFGG